MPKTVHVAGTPYSIPTTGDSDWGRNFSTWAEAVSNAAGGAASSAANLVLHGAAGNGVADDTAAVQRVFDLYSKNRATGAGGSQGAIYVPPGVYRITSTIRYAGSPAFGLRLFSDLAAGGPGGAVFRWDGANDGTMFRLEGICDSLIEGIFFDMNSKAGRGLHIEYFSVNGGGASGNVIARCHFGSPYAADSICLALGNTGLNTYQTDQVEVYDCQFGADMSLAVGTAIKTLNGGNTKNLRVKGGSMIGLKRGMDWTNASGHLWFVGVTMADITEYCIVSGSAGIAHIDAIEVENHASLQNRFLYGTTGDNPGMATIQNCFWEGATPADDYVIDFEGQLVLVNNHFLNGRTGSSQSKIRASGIGNARGGVVSIGNWYKYASGVAPIYDGSNNNVLGVDPSNTYAQLASLKVLSTNDMGGDYGSLSFLRNSSGQPMSINSAAPAAIPASVTQSSVAELRESVTKLVVPNSVWTAAATSQGFAVAQLPARTRIKSVIVDTTQAYAGLAGTIQLSVGKSAGAAEYIAAHDVKTAAVTKGLADADLGTDLARAAATQGGHIPSWTATTSLVLTLASGAGNLGNGTTTNLSAGSTIIYLTLERLP